MKSIIVLIAIVSLVAAQAPPARPQQQTTPAPTTTTAPTTTAAPTTTPAPVPHVYVPSPADQGATILSPGQSNPINSALGTTVLTSGGANAATSACATDPCPSPIAVVPNPTPSGPLPLGPNGETPVGLDMYGKPLYMAKILRPNSCECAGLVGVYNCPCTAGYASSSTIPGLVTPVQQPTTFVNTMRFEEESVEKDPARGETFVRANGGNASKGETKMIKSENQNPLVTILPAQPAPINPLAAPDVIQVGVSKTGKPLYQSKVVMPNTYQCQCQGALNSCPSVCPPAPVLVETRNKARHLKKMVSKRRNPDTGALNPTPNNAPTPSTSTPSTTQAAAPTTPATNPSSTTNPQVTNNNSGGTPQVTTVTQNGAGQTVGPNGQSSVTQGTNPSNTQAQPTPQQPADSGKCSTPPGSIIINNSNILKAC